MIFYFVPFSINSNKSYVTVFGMMIMVISVMIMITSIMIMVTISIP